jgi:hypothetical protein
VPLSTPTQRESIYSRRIECCSFLRVDGLWDIEGYLDDVREFASQAETRGTVVAGVKYHQMAMRLTIDESMTIQHIEVTLDATPYAVCSNVAANYQRLVGTSLKAGFSKAIRERLGAPEGCSHLRELLGPISTAAFQAITNLRRQESGLEEPNAREKLLDSCFALSKASPVVKRRWPEAYVGTEAT